MYLAIAIPILLVIAGFLLIALSQDNGDPDSDQDFTSDPIIYTQAGKLHPGSHLEKR
jgi:hypothetical protein